MADEWDQMCGGTQYEADAAYAATHPEPDDTDRATAAELALLARSGVGGPELREGAIREALAAAREQGRAEVREQMEALAEEMSRSTRPADEWVWRIRAALDGGHQRKEPR